MCLCVSKECVLDIFSFASIRLCVSMKNYVLMKYAKISDKK